VNDEKNGEKVRKVGWYCGKCLHLGVISYAHARYVGAGQDPNMAPETIWLVRRIRLLIWFHIRTRDSGRYRNKEK